MMPKLPMISLLSTRHLWPTLTVLAYSLLNPFDWSLTVAGKQTQCEQDEASFQDFTCYSRLACFLASQRAKR